MLQHQSWSTMKTAEIGNKNGIFYQKNKLFVENT